MSSAWKPSAPFGTRFHTVEIVDQTGSTNADLIERAQSVDGAAERLVGSVLIARHQTAGRGRQGRTWIDQPDAALLMSAAVAARPSEAGLIPLVTGTAVVSALRERAHAHAALKWPNDVLVPSRGERKLVGILAEAVPVDGQMLVVVGMGLNVEFSGPLPSDVAGRAVDLATVVGHPIDDQARTDLVIGILTALDEELGILESDGAAAALQRYRSHCLTLERAVRFEAPSGLIEGMATDLDPGGGLVVVTPDGGRHILTAGDAHHV